MVSIRMVVLRRSPDRSRPRPPRRRGRCRDAASGLTALHGQAEINSVVSLEVAPANAGTGGLRSGRTEERGREQKLGFRIEGGAGRVGFRGRVEVDRRARGQRGRRHAALG